MNRCNGVAFRRAILPMAALSVASAAAPLPAQALPALEVTLRPVANATSRQVEAIDVRLSLDPAGEPRPRLKLPLVSSNVDTIAAGLAAVGARDGRGPLRLVAGEEGTGVTAVRVWSPERAVQGTLSVTYRAPVENRLAPRGAAPPIELRAEDEAVSGAGSTFLLLPADDKPRLITVRWDLSGMPTESVGVSSLGAGDRTAGAPRPASSLQRTFFMAGRIGRHPAEQAGGPFLSAWQGTPPFDPERLMQWTGTLHGHYMRFFRLTEPVPYTVFLRRNLVNAGGGIGMLSSFVATYGPNTRPDDLKFTLAHEMFHTFSPMLSRPAGLESSWFSEGLATHYQRLLPLRFGMISPDEFLADLNDTAARYYTSVMQSVPNSEVPGRFWEDTRIRTLPYDRGALYFADLDHRIRKQSGGRRTLDDLMLEMVDRQRAGRSLGNEDWEEVVGRALGPDGVAHFRATLAGKPPLPVSDAFGACFRRTTKPLRRYELGFDPKVLVEPRRIVRGLVPGSGAATAGLRDGDEITKPVPQDSIQGDQKALMTLEIKRGEQAMTIRYLPRGETVQAWQWERIPGRSAGCAI